VGRKRRKRGGENEVEEKGEGEDGKRLIPLK